jgi:hypothetical protein
MYRVFFKFQLEAGVEESIDHHFISLQGIKTLTTQKVRLALNS